MSLWLLPRGQLISIRYCGFIACSLPPGPLIDPGFLRPRRCPLHQVSLHQAELKVRLSSTRAPFLVFRYPRRESRSRRHDFWINWTLADTRNERREEEGGLLYYIPRVLFFENDG